MMSFEAGLNVVMIPVGAKTGSERVKSHLRIPLACFIFWEIEKNTLLRLIIICR